MDLSFVEIHAVLARFVSLQNVRRLHQNLADELVCVSHSWRKLGSDMDNEPISARARESFSFDFEGVSLARTDGEIAVPLTQRHEAFKKLEVVNAREINFMARVYYIVSFVALFASVAVTILARTTFSEDFPRVSGLIPDLTLYRFPAYFTLVDSTLSFIVFTYSVGLLVLYASVIIQEGKERILNEQVWVLMLLVTSVVYFIPYEAGLRLRSEFLNQESPGTDAVISQIFLCLKVTSFAVISILYLWLGSHGYRYLDRRVSKGDVWFYLPKIAAVAVYVLYKLLILFLFQITFSELPLATLLAFFHLYATVGEWPALGVIVVAVLTVLEIGLLSMVALDIFRTSKTLREVEYAKHRTKILGFRFFLHQHVVFSTIYVLTYVFLLFGLPNGIQVFQFVLNTISEDGTTRDSANGRGSYFDVQYSPFGLLLCVLAFVTTEAYTNLPANTSLRQFLLPFWFKNVDKEKPEREPILYRSTEPPSFSEVERMDLRPGCFIMQTNVDLFNLAWFVYYHGTRKEKNLQLDYAAIPLKIRDHIYDKQTDTRVIVAESHDRVVFSFKGTSSTQNIMTDINVRLHHLSQILQETTTETDEEINTPHEIRQTTGFRRAKVHAGFATAYKSIRTELRKHMNSLLKEKKRPVFFTGHSLGGALATLSSLDACLSKSVPSNRIVVSTFGSPKVGNTAFQELYDSLLLMHWRFVAGGDLIARIPKIGYRHVGRKVYLSSTGELFIDPSELETMFWHSQSASIVHHRKSCYLLALQAWCNSLEGDYVPNFWPFPVSESDSRKFDTAFKRPLSQPLTPRTLLRRQNVNRAARLKDFAAAIDTLENQNNYSESALHHWKTLVERMLVANSKEMRAEQ